MVSGLAFAPLVVLLYWLWRVRRSSRGITVADDPESLRSLNQG